MLSIRVAARCLGIRHAKLRLRDCGPTATSMLPKIMALKESAKTSAYRTGSTSAIVEQDDNSSHTSRDATAGAAGCKVSSPEAPSRTFGQRLYHLALPGSS
jgi:hypothetical protein